MEKITYTILVIFAVLFVSCKQKETRDNKEVVPATMTDTIASENEKGVNATTNDDTIHLNFTDEKGLFTVEGTIDSLHPRIYVKFINDDLGILKAKIIPTSGQGNIRFSQIIFPDQTSDGPFGMDLDLELKQKGKHELIVGHSLMADNPYNGKFKVQLQIVGQ